MTSRLSPISSVFTVAVVSMLLSGCDNVPRAEYDAALAKAEQSFSESLAQLNDRVQELESQLANSEQIAGALKKESQNLSATTKAAAKQTKDLQDELAKMAETVTKKDSEIKQLRAQLETLQSTNRALETTAASANAELSERRIEERTLSEEVKGLRRRLARAIEAAQ